MPRWVGPHLLQEVVNRIQVRQVTDAPDKPEFWMRVLSVRDVAGDVVGAGRAAYSRKGLCPIPAAPPPWKLRFESEAWSMPRSVISERSASDEHKRLVVPRRDVVVSRTPRLHGYAVPHTKCPWLAPTKTRPLATSPIRNDSSYSNTQDWLWAVAVPG